MFDWPKNIVTFQTPEAGWWATKRLYTHFEHVPNRLDEIGYRRARNVRVVRFRFFHWPSLWFGRMTGQFKKVQG